MLTFFRKKLGRNAVILAAVSSLTPDSDIILPVKNQLESWIFHRSFSHSVFTAFFIALVIFILIMLYDRYVKKNHKYISKNMQITLYSLLISCMMIHVLLDMFNNYGTEIFWPISTKRYGFDIMAILDPFLLLPALVMTIAMLRKNVKPIFYTLSKITLVYSILYVLIVGAFVNFYIDNELKKVYPVSASSVIKVSQNPELFHPLSRTVVIDTHNAIYISYLSVNNIKEAKWEVYTKYSGPEVELAKKTYEGSNFERLTRNSSLWTQEIINGKTALVANDYRYYNPTTKSFGLYKLIFEDGKAPELVRARTFNFSLKKD